MVKRFAIAFIAFLAIVIPSAFAAALMAAPARPAPLPPAACAHDLADANAGAAAMHARMQAAAKSSAACDATRLYFLELVKTRAVTAVCTTGVQRARALGRLDSDVERLNRDIATTCR